MKNGYGEKGIMSIANKNFIKFACFAYNIIKTEIVAIKGSDDNG